MNRALTLCLALLVAGCDAGNHPPDSGGAAVAGSQQAGANEFPPAASAEELVANFQSAYESGNVDAIQQLVYWEGTVDKQGKELFLKAVFSTGSAGEGIFTKSELRPPAQEDIKPWAKLEPEAVLDYEATARDDTWSKRASPPIVKVDEHYYFYVSALPKNDE